MKFRIIKVWLSKDHRFAFRFQRKSGPFWLEPQFDAYNVRGLNGNMYSGFDTAEIAEMMAKRWYEGHKKTPKKKIEIVKEFTL